MARAGDLIENPNVGEHIRFVATSAETGGERMEMEHRFAPGGFVPVEHVHPLQEERFRVLEGRPHFRVAGTQREAAPGEELVVPAGTRHGFWNPTDRETLVNITFRPALRTEEVFEVLGAMGRAGLLNRRGIPRNPLLGALFAREFRSELRASGFPWGPASALASLGAGLARLLGLRLPSVEA